MKKMINFFKTNKSDIVLFTGLTLFLAALVIGLVVYKRSQTAEAVADMAVTIREPEIVIDTNATEVKDAADSNPFANRYVSYSCLSDVNAEKGVITQLVNPAENPEDVYMKFTIQEEGKAVFETDLIPAGMASNVEFAYILAPGNHHVTIIMSPYLLYKGEYLQCPVNNAQEIDISVL